MVVKRSPSSIANVSAADNIFERFEVEFDAGTSPVFHGGELITGSLKIQLKKEVTINAIHIQFRGRAVWLDPKHPTKEAGEKIYFDKNFVLLERPPGHPEPGHFPWSANFLYSLPFECPLPKGCETSYEGPHGFIRYYSRAILEIAEPDNAKYIIKQCFSIISSPELNQLVPPISDPISEKKTVRFGSCCCRGKMTAEIILPKSSYAPGEDVIGNFSINSSSAKNVLEHIEVRLIDRLSRITSDLEPFKEASPLPEPINGIETKTKEKNSKNKQKQKNGINEAAINNEKQLNTKEVFPFKENKKQKKTNSISTTKPSPSSTSSTERHRVVFGRRLVKEDFKGETTNERKNSGDKNVLIKKDVYFLRIPSVVPTTQGKNILINVKTCLFVLSQTTTKHITDNQLQQSSQFDELVDGVGAENGQFHRLLESPSTATLRARREPFLRVDYALQIYLGTHVLVELPIQIHPIPIYAKGIGFQPFAGGPQSVVEPDESNYIPFKGPFTFAPLYPVYLETPKILVVSEDTILEEPVSEPIKTPTPKPLNGIKSEELQQQPFIVLTKEEKKPKTNEGETTTTTTIITEKTNTKEEENKKEQIFELNKKDSEIKEKPLELNNKENNLPEKIIVEEQNLQNGGTKITTVEESSQQNGEETVKKSVVETENYELNNDDGSTVNVQKTITTTTTELTTTTPTLVINGDHYNDLNNDQHQELNQQENNLNNTTKNKENNNEIIDNQQMDVSITE
ncbi:Arrestin_C domain-containing protein [Meloidogyne graminicola]|uniref:Arrestin_C domain-containing protein n=1 Tax=Meloidogyne graminicola TaxID=189291 RepID=A0A8S9ZWN4_9BILA|nr:Arrestin_C domain-containing protein [Meloidogyne graminicola]